MNNLSHARHEATGALIEAIRLMLAGITYQGDHAEADADLVAEVERRFNLLEAAGFKPYPESQQARQGTAHTPEPWIVANENGDEVLIQATVSGSIPAAAWMMGGDFDGEGPMQEAHANARRIVACVNACAQIPTGRLEAMNAQGPGLLAGAVRACDTLARDWGEELVNDEPINGGDAVETLAEIADDALRVAGTRDANT